MDDNRYATSEAIIDLLNTAPPSASRDRTAAIIIAIACLGAIVSALLLISRYLPSF